MIDTLQNIFRVSDLRKRVIFVALMLLVFRIGGHIPVPGANYSAIEAMVKAMAEGGGVGGLAGFIDMFTGQALSQMMVFALGIMPYISASIILQLLTVVVPALERLSKEGELGKKKITQYTRYGTVLIAAIQGFGLTFYFKSLSAPGYTTLLTASALNNDMWWRIMTVLTLTAGTAFIMWIGEQITERGIGNGISLLIFAGIIVGLFPGIIRAIGGITGGASSSGGGNFTLIQIILLVAIVVGMIMAIVFVERGQRRIPVSYAKRVVGRKIYGGQSTYIPLRINTAGVIPVIFASSILLLPQWVFGQLSSNYGWPWWAHVNALFQYGHFLYLLGYVAAIIFFCFFYTQIVFNPKDVADNMKKYGSFIPGKRPGKRTADYIGQVLNRVTTAGAVYLAIISIVPIILFQGIKLGTLAPFLGGLNLANYLPNWVNTGLDVPFYFGGTSLLIVIGVAMDTVNQIESQLVMRHYDGFFKGTRVKGRR